MWKVAPSELIRTLDPYARLVRSQHIGHLKLTSIGIDRLDKCQRADVIKAQLVPPIMWLLTTRMRLI